MMFGKAGAFVSLLIGNIIISINLFSISLLLCVIVGWRLPTYAKGYFILCQLKGPFLVYEYASLPLAFAERFVLLGFSLMLAFLLVPLIKNKLLMILVFCLAYWAWSRLGMAVVAALPELPWI